MSNYFLLVFLPNLGVLFCALGFIGIVSCIVGLFIYIEKKSCSYNKEHEDEAREFAKNIIRLFIGTLTTLFLTCFIPDKKDIIQLKVISVVSELKDVDQIPQKLVDRLNNILSDEK